jgi:phosphonate transport system ATP-binding protein
VSQPLLSVKHLSKTYANGIVALDDVSFAVEPGEFLVVIGLSGSGKSTLLRCLNRLLDPSSGQIYFQQQEVTRLRGSQILTLRRHMAMIFQHFNLIARHSVLSNVLMGKLGTTPVWRSLLKLHSETEIADAIRLLQLVGLDEKWQERADHLSGGQQQRVAIARALNQQPQLLLADEPVASLDPATCYSVMNYLKKINQEMGLTIICNLHFLSLVREFATRVIALKAGRLVFEGKPEAIDKQWFKEIYGEEARELYVR